MKKEKFDVAKMVTEKILEALDKNIVPWRKTWNYNGDGFKNIRSKKEYSGVNVLLLSMSTNASGYNSNLWMTYKQCSELGGNIKKGSKATTVVYYRILESNTGDKDKDGNDIKKRFPLLKYYNVFNLNQTENIPEEKLPKNDEEKKEIKPIEECEKVIKGYKDCPEINVGKPAYIPALDKIKMPTIQSFEDKSYYYSTAFHEFSHSTGSKNRLNREGVANFDQFGSEKYSLEELISEISATFLSNKCGLDSEKLFENSISYISHWKEKLSKEPKLIIQASSKAQKATDYILTGKKDNYEKEGVNQ